MELGKDTLGRIKALTQINDHGGAYQFAAYALGLNELAERFRSINLQHLELGHLPSRLYEERFVIYQELMAFARANLGKTEFQKFYAVF